MRSVCTELGAANTPNAFQRQLLHVDKGERVEQFGFDNEKPRAGVAQIVRKLRPARGDVERHRNGAEPGAAEKSLHELGAVAAHQRNAVAGTECRQPPAPRQSAPQCAGASAKLQLTSPAANSGRLP